MRKANKSAYRGPMIHIRLDREIHMELKVLAAQNHITIQKLVEDLIRRRILRSKQSNKDKSDYRE